MWSFIHHCFTKLDELLHKTLELAEQQCQLETPSFVYRDELSYNNNNNKKEPLQTELGIGEQQQQLHPMLDSVKLVDRITNVDHRRRLDHLICNNTKKPEINIRVKIRMTKNEAERLLSKFRTQNKSLRLTDIAADIAAIPPHRIEVLSYIDSIPIS